MLEVCVGPGKPNLPLEVQGISGGFARVTAGPKRPHLGLCPGPNVLLQGRQGSRAESPHPVAHFLIWNLGVSAFWGPPSTQHHLESEVTQLCPTLCNPMDCSLSGSSVHGFFQARVPGVDCHFLLQGIFPTQELNPGVPHCGQTLYHLSHQGSPP